VYSSGAANSRNFIDPILESFELVNLLCLRSKLRNHFINW
jgi:hypothetical protein